MCYFVCSLSSNCLDHQHRFRDLRNPYNQHIPLTFTPRYHQLYNKKDMKLLQFTRIAWPYICLYLFFSNQFRNLNNADTIQLSTHAQEASKLVVNSGESNEISQLFPNRSESAESNLRDLRKELGELTK